MKSNQIKRWAVVSILLLSMIGIAHAEGYDDLANTLTDLSGWSAEEAEGAVLKTSHISMLQAVREYQNGDKRVTAEFLVTNLGETMATMQDMQMENSGMQYKSEEIGGFRVFSIYNKTDNLGSIIIGLGSKGKSATLRLYFKSMTDAEAMDIAREFNWGNMKKIAKVHMQAILQFR